MSTYTIPAIAGRMGSTKYYQAVMRADELVATVHAAMDFPEFKNFMAHEQMQRKLSEERVEKMIVPYLTNSVDRFFGSIIVLVFNPDEFTFEPMRSLGVPKLPNAYGGLEQRLGALTIGGGMLFALDGQHRLHALRTVINETQTPHLGLPIDGPYKDDVRSDMLSVIFLEFESTEKARRIFNKVNRYAKPTSTSTNILTSEDDGVFIITRCVASLDEPLGFYSYVAPPIPLKFKDGGPVVQLEGASLEAKSTSLTTLELLSESIESLCTATGQPPLTEEKTIVRPDDLALKTAYEVCARWWSELMVNFEPFANALRSPNRLPDWRANEALHSVAYRPNGQEALLRGLADAHSISKMSPTTLVDRMNHLPLSLSDDVWDGILLGGGDHRRRVLGFRPVAANLVTYLLIGPDAFGARRTQRLLDNYIESKAKYNIVRRVLPKPVV